MRNHTILYFDSYQREVRLSELKFFYEQANSRLLSQFSSIEADAEKYAKSVYEKWGQNYNPDVAEREYAEAAWEAGEHYYVLLEEMQKITRLSLVAGMYHEWDKQLREWLVREFCRLKVNREGVRKIIWDKPIDKIFDFLEMTPFKIRSSHYFDVLDACRLVVNVYKHGQGVAFNTLKVKYPKFLQEHHELASDWIGYSFLNVTDAHFEEFYKAFQEFWEAVPTYVMDNEFTGLPKWLEDAMK